MSNIASNDESQDGHTDGEECVLFASFWAELKKNSDGSFIEGSETHIPEIMLLFGEAAKDECKDIETPDWVHEIFINTQGDVIPPPIRVKFDSVEDAQLAKDGVYKSYLEDIQRQYGSNLRNNSILAARSVFNTLAGVVTLPLLPFNLGSVSKSMPISFFAGIKNGYKSLKRFDKDVANALAKDTPVITF